MEPNISLTFKIPLNIVQNGNAAAVQQFVREELMTKMAEENRNDPAPQLDINPSSPGPSASSAQDPLGALLQEMQKIREQNSVLSAECEKLLNIQESNHRTISEKLAQNEDSIEKLKALPLVLSDTPEPGPSSSKRPRLEKEIKQNESFVKNPEIVQEIQNMGIQETAEPQDDPLSVNDGNPNERPFTKMLNLDYTTLSEEQVNNIAENLLLGSENPEDTKQIVHILKKMFNAIRQTSYYTWQQWLHKRICDIYEDRSIVTKLTTVNTESKEASDMFVGILSINRLIADLYNSDALPNNFIDVLLDKMEFTAAVIDCPKISEIYNTDAFILITNLFEQIQEKLFGEVGEFWFLQRLPDLLNLFAKNDAIKRVETEIMEVQHESQPPPPPPPMEVDPGEAKYKTGEKFGEQIADLASRLDSEELNVLYEFFSIVHEKRLDDIDTLNFMILGEEGLEELIAILWRDVLDSKRSNTIPSSIEILKKIMIKLTMDYNKEMMFLELLKKQATKKFSTRSAPFRLSDDQNSYDKDALAIRYQEMLKIMRFIGHLFNEEFLGLLFVKQCLEELDIESMAWLNSDCMTLVTVFMDVIQEKLIETDIEYLFHVNEKAQAVINQKNTNVFRGAMEAVRP